MEEGSARWVWDPKAWETIEKLVAHVEPMLAALLYSPDAAEERTREQVLTLIQGMRQNRQILDGQLEF